MLDSRGLIPSIATTPAGGVRAVFTFSNPPVLSYRECDADCGNAASWSADQPLFYSQSGAARLTSDAQGRLRMAWYQGVSGDPNAASTDNLVIYGWCDGTCTVPTNWGTSTVSLAAQDGMEGVDVQLDSSGAPAIAVRQVGGGLKVAFCDTGCTSTSGNWQTAVVEDIGEVDAQTTPPLPACGTMETPVAFWNPGIAPAIAIHGGNVSIAHITELGQRCDPMGSNGPISTGALLVRLYSSN